MQNRSGFKHRRVRGESNEDGETRRQKQIELRVDLEPATQQESPGANRPGLLVFMEKQPGHKETTQHEEKIDAYPPEMRNQQSAICMPAEDQQNGDRAQNVKGRVPHVTIERRAGAKTLHSQAGRGYTFPSPDLADSERLVGEPECIHLDCRHEMPPP